MGSHSKVKIEQQSDSLTLIDRDQKPDFSASKQSSMIARPSLKHDMLENLDEFLEEEDAETPSASKPNLQANRDEIDELLEEANVMVRSSQ